MKYLHYVSYLCLFIGLTLFVIWIVQKFSTSNILEDPLTGAGLFISIGFILSVLARRDIAT